jgi:hypothetical protein
LDGLRIKRLLVSVGCGMGAVGDTAGSIYRPTEDFANDGFGSF